MKKKIICKCNEDLTYISTCNLCKRNFHNNCYLSINYEINYFYCFECIVTLLYPDSEIKQNMHFPILVNNENIKKDVDIQIPKIDNIDNTYLRIIYFKNINDFSSFSNKSYKHDIDIYFDGSKIDMNFNKMYSIKFTNELSSDINLTFISKNSLNINIYFITIIVKEISKKDIIRNLLNYCNKNIIDKHNILNKNINLYYNSKLIHIPIISTTCKELHIFCLDSYADNLINNKKSRNFSLCEICRSKLLFEHFKINLEILEYIKLNKSKILENNITEIVFKENEVKEIINKKANIITNDLFAKPIIKQANKSNNKTYINLNDLQINKNNNIILIDDDESDNNNKIKEAKIQNIDVNKLYIVNKYSIIDCISNLDEFYKDATDYNIKSEIYYIVYKNISMKLHKIDNIIIYSENISTHFSYKNNNYNINIALKYCLIKNILKRFNLNITSIIKILIFTMLTETNNNIINEGYYEQFIIGICLWNKLSLIKKNNIKYLINNKMLTKFIYVTQNIINIISFTEIKNKLITALKNLIRKYK